MDIQPSEAFVTPEEEEYNTICDEENFDIDEQKEITKESNYREIGLFKEARWERLRFYLDNVRFWDTINDLDVERELIIYHLTGLGVFTREDAAEFERLVDKALRVIELKEVVYR